ncbi:MAG: CorA family divalent cation transporter, partial [Patescibacteria group bacterium]|nr:CorA family divalent cation transporter [Patescibacteria group bacterium]
PLQRPKVNLQNDYLFMVLLFPVYRRKTREIITAELDVFIGKDYLVTAHNNDLSPLINLFNLCQINENQRQKYFKNNPTFLIYEVLNRLCCYCQPILDDMQLATASIEEHIFRGYERRMVREILIVKRNIINLRQITRVHESVLSQFVTKGEKFLDFSGIKANFLELIESTGDMWNLLENLYQNIEALEETNNSLVSFRLNDIVKILTTISVLALPITIVTSLFSMNIHHSPLIDYPAAFWILISGMIILFAFLLFYVKRKKWI